MANRLILDTDGGVDDAQALLMLIAGGRAPDAVTTVFGNVDLESATRNIGAVLTLAGCGDIPVHMGAAGPLDGHAIAAREIHGDDGLGGAPRPDPAHPPASGDAVAFLTAELRAAASAGEAIDLLMIGPLTNLALVLQAAPDAAAGVGRLTIMGATLNARGNVTPAAEFNIYADPEAARIVLCAGLNTLVVPWEPCMAHRMEAAAVDALFAAMPDTPLARFSKALSDHARRVIRGYTGRDFFRFVDPLAAAVTLDPGLVIQAQRASVEVVLTPGVARGLVLVDPSGRLGTPAVDLLESADLDGVIALYRASVF